MNCLKHTSFLGQFWSKQLNFYKYRCNTYCFDVQIKCTVLVTTFQLRPRSHYQSIVSFPAQAMGLIKCQFNSCHNIKSEHCKCQGQTNGRDKCQLLAEQYSPTHFPDTVIYCLIFSSYVFNIVLNSLGCTRTHPPPLQHLHYTLAWSCAPFINTTLLHLSCGYLMSSTTPLCFMLYLSSLA